MDGPGEEHSKQRESKCKGPGVKVHLACLKNSKEEGSDRWGEEWEKRSER